MISVIIPVYNDTPHITLCLNSILSCNYEGGIEIIVVDDGSSDGLRELVNSFPCSFIATGKNSGPGPARNLGAKSAKGDIVAFVDSDCIVASNWLSIIDNIFRDNKIKAVAGRFSENLNPEFIARYRYCEASFYMINEKTFVNTFTASSFACRKDLFLKVGGFGNRPAAEEITLGYRLYKIGINILCVPEFVVAHHCLSTLKGYLKQQFAWMKNFFIACQFYPEMVYFKGLLKKDNLILQMILQILSIISVIILLMLNKPVLVILIILISTASFFLLNFSFLCYVGKKEKSPLVILKSIFAILIRNSVWIVAILCGIKVKRLIPFLFVISSRKAALCNHKLI
jgi:glycosyltransferase involved in cell wall biosynthesis